VSSDRWGVIDERSIAEARELIGVPLRRDRMQWNEVATGDAIRQFADGVGDDNPLWRDPDYASRSRWGGTIALPSFLYAVDATIVAPKLPGVQWIYAGTRWRWYDVIREDTRFDVEASFTRMDTKTGKRFGLWVLQTGEIVYRGDDGAVLCIAEGRVARTPRRRKSSSAAEPAPKKELRPAGEAHTPRLSTEGRRGATPRLWENTQLGDTIGPIARPLALDDIFAYYTGAQGALHYGGAHGDAVRYRRRHDDYEINTETGVKDSAARGHFSSKEGKDVGMGGAYDVGLQRIGWVVKVLTDWMGDDAHLAEADIDVLQPNLVGDTTYFSATVTDRWFDEHAFVAFDVEGHNQKGALTTRGRAIITLPSAEHGPVTLPLFGGDPERWTDR
jgi:acyl dehydratase